jgi:Protein-tyrosine-phosphatase
MTKILFVCHGNICRSPMAEFVMKHIANQAGLSSDFEIASAGTSAEELGNPVYPQSRDKMLQHGIDSSGKFARKLRRDDYDHYDYLVGMDAANYRNMLKMYENDPDNKISLLLGFAGQTRDIADPWYTGNFEETWQDVNLGCKAMMKSITDNT